MFYESQLLATNVIETITVTNCIRMVTEDLNTFCTT